MDDVNTLLEGIERDLALTKWLQVPLGAGYPHNPDAEMYTGTGARWTHNLYAWPDNGKVLCDGTASSSLSGIVIRYPPEIAIQALQLVIAGGLRK